jgi:hypothetical protein
MEDRTTVSKVYRTRSPCKFEDKRGGARTVQGLSFANTHTITTFLAATVNPQVFNLHPFTENIFIYFFYTCVIQTWTSSFAKFFFQSVIIKVTWISSLLNQYWTSSWLKEVFAGPNDNTNQRHEWYNLLATSRCGSQGLVLWLYQGMANSTVSTSDHIPFLTLPRQERGPSAGACPNKTNTCYKTILSVM